MAEEKQEQDPEAQGKPIGEESPVFPTIGDPEAEAEQEKKEKRERGEAPEPEEPKEDPDRKRLEKELEEARERERRMQATLERFAQQPQQPQQAQPQPDDDSDLGEPPDPVNDPKGYHQYMTKLVDRRAQRQAQQITQESTQQQTQQQQLNDLWNRFQSKYSDVAQHDIVVEGVTKREVERLRNSGVDPMQYIMSDPDGFVDRIASESKNYLSERGVPLQGKQKQETDPQADTGRTAGLDGSRPQSPKGKGGQDEGTSFTDEIKKEQVNSGFF